MARLCTFRRPPVGDMISIFSVMSIPPGDMRLPPTVYWDITVPVAVPDGFDL